MFRLSLILSDMYLEVGYITIVHMYCLLDHCTVFEVSKIIRQMHFPVLLKV